MTDDLIERMKEALGEYEKNKKEWRHGFAKELFATPALTLLPEAIKEIEELRGKLAEMQSGQPYTYYGRDGKPVLARDLEDRAEAAEAKLAKVVEAGVDVAASLNAAISLLERGGKKAAPSDKMFAQILVDYSASLDRFRTTLAELTGGKDE